MKDKKVVIGVGVIIVNAEGKVLIGKRQGSWPPYYSIPGGHLGVGETFEDAAKREIREETGLIIHAPKVIAVTNNLETWREQGNHTVSVILAATDYTGEPKVMEPAKCASWQWCDPRELPEPHFDASRNGIRCFLERVFYGDD